jgi:hypothetical protein
VVLHGFGLNFQVFVDQSENNLRCKYECIFRSKLLFFVFYLEYGLLLLLARHY